MSPETVRETSFSPRERTLSNTFGPPFPRIPPTVQFPTKARSIFCHMSIFPEQNFKPYRLRDGDTRFIKHFLYHAIGPDGNFDPFLASWMQLDSISFPPHLVEIVLYGKNPQESSEKAITFYCALTEETEMVGEILNEYQVLPISTVAGAQGRPIADGMDLLSSWFIECTICNQWYQVNVYR